MPPLIRLTTIPLLFTLAGCDTYVYVSKKEYDGLQQNVAESTKQLSNTKKELEEARVKIGEMQAHRYSMFRQASRTWRMDAVTGNSCLMLTTEQDWKRPETARESCQCEDLLNSPVPSGEVMKAMGCFK